MQLTRENSHTLGHRNLTTWFWLFTSFYVALWTLMPAMFRYNLPMDSLEASVWGQQLAFGYDKNPYLNAWLVALIDKISNYSDWAIYLGSKLFVALAFYSVWRLAKRFVSPSYALIAVLMLTYLQYFTTAAVELNDNVIEMGLWAATISYFYTSVHDNRSRDWWLCGIFAGLCFMAKYYTVLLLLCLLAYLLVSKIGRKTWQSSGPYIVITSIILLALPNIFWLFQNNFLPFKYTLGSMALTNQQAEFISIPWYRHITEPLRFSVNQLLAIAVPLIILFVIQGNIKSVWQNRLKPASILEKDNLLFLGLVTVGPLFLTCLISLILGNNIRTNWGQPLLTFWGLGLLYWLRPNLNDKNIKWFIGLTITVILLIASGYGLKLRFKGDNSSATVPAKDIAIYVENAWHAHYPNKPYKYIVGNRHFAGQASRYSQARPLVYQDLNPDYNPDITLSELKKNGAVFIWDINELGLDVPSIYRQKFSNLVHPKTNLFYRKKTNHKSAVGVGIVFLNPS